MSIRCFDRIEIIRILAGQLSTVAAMADVSFSLIVSLSDPLRKIDPHYGGGREHLCLQPQRVGRVRHLVFMRVKRLVSLLFLRIMKRENRLEADSVEHHDVKRCLFCRMFQQQDCYRPLGMPLAMDTHVDS
ncbi:hypothetical protein Tco_0747164 [Tanacetum coccineum]